jgi:hypothetical protein
LRTNHHPQGEARGNKLDLAANQGIASRADYSTAVFRIMAWPGFGCITSMIGRGVKSFVDIAFHAGV